MVQLSPGARSPAASRKSFTLVRSFVRAQLLAPILALALACLAAPGAQAQFFGQQQQQAPEPPPVADSASLVRIDRLENQVRNLNGQVEQLQYQVKRLEDQLRKFQMDVDQRFMDSAPGARSAPAPRTPAATPQKHSELEGAPAEGASTDSAALAANATPNEASVAAVAPEAAAPVAAPAQTAAAQTVAAAQSVAAPTVTVGVDGRRHDAFDPNAIPNAPGAPLQLGSADSASRPLEGAPADPRGAPNASVSPASDPIKAQYEVALEQLRGQRYDAAQQAFAEFIQANPHSRLIAPAIFHLGESFAAQGRHREAAEQFLKIAQDFSRTSVAPEAMIKLGVSLYALGAKEQACAVFADAPRKYPNASAAQKAAAEREARKAAC